MYVNLVELLALYCLPDHFLTGVSYPKDNPENEKGGRGGGQRYNYIGCLSVLYYKIQQLSLEHSLVLCMSLQEMQKYFKI